jgi:PAS domain S-box-containing protein
MKITLKLSLLFLLISTLPIILIGFLAYDSGRQAIDQNTINHLVSTSIYKQNALERWVQTNQGRLRSFAQSPQIIEFASQLVAQEQAEPGDSTAYTSILNDHLKPSLKEEGGFLDLFILRGSDGLVVIATDKNLEGRYKESESYFIEGKESTFVQNVYYSMTLEEAAMTISTPIFDQDGQLIAVLAGHLDLKEMSDIMLRRSGLSATEDTYLVNKFNFFVTEPRFDQEGQALIKATHTQGVEACLEHNDDVGYYNDYRDIPVIGAYRWIPERELCILTEVDQAEAFAPTLALRNTILATGFLAAALAALAGAISARAITRPVNRLVRGAEEIGRGNLEYHIEAGSNDEIGNLEDAFNEMAAKLHDSLGQTAYSQRLLLALSQAAQAVQRARTPEEIYEIVGNEITSLGFNALTFHLTEDRSHLTISHLTFDSRLLRAAEKLAGTSAKDFQPAIEPGDIYDEIISGRQTVYLNSMADRMFKSVPNLARPLARQIASMLGIEQGIYAPLIIGDEVKGMLAVIGSDLPETDMPAVTIFANQIAIALDNIKLLDDTQTLFETEQLIAGISASFVNMPSDQLDAGVTQALKKIGQFSGTVRASLFMLDDDLSTITNTHEWCADPTDSQIQLLQGIPFEAFGYYQEILLKLENVIVSRLDDLPPDKARGEREWVKEHGFRPLLFIPMLFNGKLRGTMGFYGRVAEEIDWPEEFIEMLRFAGNIIISAIQRRQAEEEMRSANERLQYLISSSPTVIYTSRVSGDYSTTFISANVVELLGFEFKMFIEDPDFWANHIHPEDATRVFDNFPKLYDHDHHSFEYRFLHHDGSYRWMRDEIRLVRDDDGKPLETIGSMIDITERKRAEQALRLSDTKFRGIDERSKDGIIMTDEQGLIVNWNDSLEQITGLSADGVLGRYVFDVLHSLAPPELQTPEIYQRLAKAYDDALNTGQSPLLDRLREVEYIQPNGEHRITQEMWFTIEAEKGYMLGTIVRDVSERKEMQERLVRTEKLAVLGQLAGGVGHELRNPLGAIKNAAYFLNMVLDAPGRETKEMLELLEREVAKTERIISDLLDFARVKSPTRRKVAINQTIHEALSLIETPHNIQLTSQLAEDLPDLLADPGQLEQIFSNIILNGIQAMPDGGQLTVETRLDSPQWLAVAIADTGSGISPVVLAKIFEPLFTTKAKGIGLGLAIVKTLVEGHGGDIAASSEGAPGKGSTFTVRLPLTGFSKDSDTTP